MLIIHKPLVTVWSVARYWSTHVFFFPNVSSSFHIVDASISSTDSIHRYLSIDYLYSSSEIIVTLVILSLSLFCGFFFFLSACTVVFFNNF